MKILRGRGWLVCGLAVLVAATAGAQEEEIRGELARGDREHPERDAYVDYYTIEAEEGELMTVIMEGARGTNMDTYLIVEGPSGQEYSNDDAIGIFSGSKITFLVPESGEWEIAATGYDSDARGRYVLTINRQQTEEILSERGELEDGDRILPKQGEYYDVFTFDAEEGKTYIVMCTSDDFDTFLSVHYPGGLEYNDDSDSGTDMSMVSFTAEEDGEANIVMTSYAAEMEGRYQVTVLSATGNAGGGGRRRGTDK